MFNFSIPEEKPLNELLSLKGKVAVITGGSRGIGKQMVRRFTEAGAKVVFTGRGLEALKKVEAEFKDKGFDVAYCQADVSIVDESKKVVDFTVKKYGRVDVIVNNAASFPFCDVYTMTEKVWDECFNTDAKGTFFMSKFAAAQMIKQGEGGRIINFMSTAALNPTGPLIAYGAAKQAVWYVTRTMAQEFAQYGITVNAATPGATMTEERLSAFSGNATEMQSFIEKSGNSGLDFTKQLGDKNLDTMGGLVKQAMPMGRTGFPDDLAKAVLFLASDMGSYVTGQNITVDGAQSIQNPMGAMMSQMGSGASVQTSEKDEKEEVQTELKEASVSVDGDWGALLDTPMGKNDVVFSLKAEGNVVSGTVAIAGNTIDFDKGSVSGNEVRFNFKMKAGLMKAKVEAIGTIESDTFKGEVRLPVAGIPFEAHRK